MENQTKQKKPFAVVIMAAGKGTRMKDPSKAKVMYEILGKPMLHYVLELAYVLDAQRIVTVIGYQGDAVMSYLQKNFPNVDIAVQAEQLGTGHAVLQAEPYLKDFQGDVIVLSGDVPLLTEHTMRNLITVHRVTNATATILTAEFPDPTGYGRVIRNKEGMVEKIVEHKDATEEERNVREINSGIYVFDCKKLFEALRQITPQNAQNEYYLTDVFQYFWKNHLTVAAMKTEHIDEIRGVNTVQQLNEMKQILMSRS